MDRRTASMPLPDRRAVGGASGGQTPELYAALSRRLRIVEGSGGCSSHGMKAARMSEVAAAAVAAAVAHGTGAEARSPSPNACVVGSPSAGRHPGGGPQTCTGRKKEMRAASTSMPVEGQYTRRFVQGLPPGNAAPPQGSLGATLAAPPPSAAGAAAGTSPPGGGPLAAGNGRLAVPAATRGTSPAAGGGGACGGGQWYHPQQLHPQGAQQNASRAAAMATPRTNPTPVGWNPMCSDRVRKYTWPRQTVPTPGQTSTTTAAGSSVVASPVASSSGSAEVQTLSQVPSAASGVSLSQVEAGARLNHCASNGGIVGGRAWRGSREPHMPFAEDVIIAERSPVAVTKEAPVQQQMQQCSPEASRGSPVGELADLRRDIAVYVDLARDEKQARHEAQAAHRSAELRAEDAVMAQRRAEQAARSAETQLGERTEQAADLEARNAALERHVLALETRLTAERRLEETDAGKADRLAELQIANVALETEVLSLREHLQNATVQVVEKLGDTLQRSNTELEAYRSQMQQEVATRGRMDAQIMEIRLEKRKITEELMRMKKENEGLRRQVQDIAVAGLRAGGRSSAATAVSASPSPPATPTPAASSPQESPCPSPPAPPPPTAASSPADAGAFGGSSESRLRTALARGGATTTEELQEAVGAVEALLNEAKRELSARQFRRRRAAFEALHRAEASGDEPKLAEAVAEAVRAEVDAEDVERAEATLASLRSMSQEEKAAKEARAQKAKHKEQAFLFVKRDNAEGLQRLIEGLEEGGAAAASAGPRWTDWKDHSGRTLWRCAVELRSMKVQAALRPMLGMQKAPEEAKARGRPSPVQAPAPAPSDVAGTVTPPAPAAAAVAALAGSPVAAAAAPTAVAAAAPAPLPEGGSGGRPAGHVSASPERSPVLHAHQASGDAAAVASAASGPAPGLPPLPVLGGDAATAAEAEASPAAPRKAAAATASSPAPETTPEAPTPLASEPPVLPGALTVGGAGTAPGVATAKRGSEEPAEKAEEPTPAQAAQEPPPEPIKDEAELRTKAFRAVVKDDTAALAEVVVDRVPCSVWSAWQNKAGKDLLTLSEERGSSAAYSLLAKALGLLKERKRESFEEREAVWVLFNGEVQPRRATVLEDTPPECNDVLLEFWDGDEPATQVDRNLVLKACN